VVIGTDCRGNELTFVVVIGTDCRGNELTTVVVIGTDCRGNELTTVVVIDHHYSYEVVNPTICPSPLQL
jgi:predicted RNase H-related nuclease YkuK (DUF458 family)